MSRSFLCVEGNGGLDSDESSLYKAKEGHHRYNPRYSAAGDSGFVSSPVDKMAFMKSMASMGPISVVIDASHDSFQFYEGGVYYDPKCSTTYVDHAIPVVGYGSEGPKSDNKKCWLVKNSWGEEWGMNGYIMIAKDWNNHCAIASIATYPIM